MLERIILPWKFRWKNLNLNRVILEIPCWPVEVMVGLPHACAHAESASAVGVARRGSRPSRACLLLDSVCRLASLRPRPRPTRHACMHVAIQPSPQPVNRESLISPYLSWGFSTLIFKAVLFSLTLLVGSWDFNWIILGLAHLFQHLAHRMGSGRSRWAVQRPGRTKTSGGGEDSQHGRGRDGEQEMAQWPYRPPRHAAGTQISILLNTSFISQCKSFYHFPHSYWC